MHQTAAVVCVCGVRRACEGERRPLTRHIDAAVSACVVARGHSQSPSASPHPTRQRAAWTAGPLMVLLLLDSELVSGVLGVPGGRVVVVVSDADRLVSVLQLRRLDRELVAVPQIVTTSLIVGIQLNERERRK